MMSIFKDQTQSFAAVLTKELAVIAEARQARGIFTQRQPPPQSQQPPGAPEGAGPQAAVNVIAEAAAQTREERPAFTARLRGSLAQGISSVRSFSIASFLVERTIPEPALHLAEALDRDLVGVAISGGGIRSATLSLGILQGFAQRGLLKHVDYLSTVSGGGYIGSWLISWIRRCVDLRLPKRALDAKEALEKVERDLKPESPLASGADHEPIHYLRSYSNYLTPDVSFLSADTWTLAAIWTRNTLLNVAIIVCGLAVLLLLPRFAGYGLLRLPPPSSPSDVEIRVIVFALVIAAACTGFNLYALGQDKPRWIGRQASVQKFIVVPLVVAAAAMAEWMLRVPSLFVDDWLQYSLVFTLLYVIAAVVGRFPQGFVDQHRSSPFHPGLLWVVGLALALGASILAGVLAAACMHGLALAADFVRVAHHDWLIWAALCAAPPCILLAVALGLILQIGLMGHDLPDASREWLGRLRAWTMIYSAGWALLTGLSIVGPYLLYWAGSTASLSLGGIWSIVSATGLLAGSGEKTDGQPKSEGFDWKGVCLDAVVKVAPFVFILGFATLIALGIHELLSPNLPADLTSPQPRVIALAGAPDPVTLNIGEPSRPLGHFELRRRRYVFEDLKYFALGQPSRSNIDFYNLGSLFLLAAVGGFILSWRVDINDFSMHHFYKNRLVRCYLGASRDNRRPDPFIGFDSQDDLSLSSFAPGHGDAVETFAREKYCGPYPILNGALNLAGGNALAWQERQAASFVFSPLYCGYDKSQVDGETGKSATEGLRFNKNAYTPTIGFAHEGGIRVGTAMGISGAAASPNAGYHTSTAVAFLLTLFNARLGCWLGNPARVGKEDNHGPTFGLTYLITELFGLATTNKAYVNVSDGGHFENLGIYELVKRRCRYIIVCDGEQDDGMKFEGLANAIRKCRTDFDVEIDIDVEQLRLKNGFSHAHCVVGKITYPPDGPDPAGYLLYLKASLTGNEDTDVLQYHSMHRAFPHESTADQWFNESQFESYRKLGLHIVDSALQGAGCQMLQGPHADDQTYKDVKARLFKDLWVTLYPPSDAIQKSFTRHTDEYTRLIQGVVKGKDTSYLDPAIFSKWADFPPVVPNTREGRYLCASFIQLVENVYLDLHLDEPKQREHPHNAGWLTLFRQWAVSDAFRDAWELARYTYGTNFQRFFDSLIKQELLRFAATWLPVPGPAAVLPDLTQLVLSVAGTTITGSAITRSHGVLNLAGARFNGPVLTFTLTIPGVGPANYCLRLHEEAQNRAFLANQGSATPRTTLQKA